MKFQIIPIIILSLAISAIASISDIEENGSWYYLLNEKGARYKTMSKSNVGELAGFCESYFVGKNGSWYYFFDDKGTRFMTRSVSELGTIRHVNNKSFTTQKGNWIYTFDKKGKRTGTKAAK